MRFEIDIEYPQEKMAASRRRMDAYAAFRIADRVPVGFCIVPRYFAPIFGIRYADVFKSVEDHFYLQLQFLKYRIENIPEDLICQRPVLTVGPYFDNVLDSDAFGAETVWPENETLHALPSIHTIEEMDAMEIPDADSGLWGRCTEWWLEMKELADQTRLTFNTREGKVELALLGIGGFSPHMIAVDLVGIDFYLWQAEYPEKCSRFLEKIAFGLIRAEKRFRTIDPRPRNAFSLAEDPAQVLSPRMFRDFCVPVDDLLFNAIGSLADGPERRHGANGRCGQEPDDDGVSRSAQASPDGGGLRDGRFTHDDPDASDFSSVRDVRGIHMCGDSVHLHRVLKEELKITSFNIFGYNVPPSVAAANFAGRIYLWGNINPMLMRDGTKQDVKNAARECLTALGNRGGYMLGDGANVCPGTPPENLAAVTEAAEEFSAERL